MPREFGLNLSAWNERGIIIESENRVRELRRYSSSIVYPINVEHSYRTKRRDF